MAPGSIIGSLEQLPARFLGDPSGRLKARFRIRIGNAARDVVVTPDTCGVEATNGRPDAEIRTSPTTWLDIDRGRLSGIEAFAQRRLSLRGSIQRSLLFEPLFERPDGGGMHYSIERVPVRNLGISTLVAGPRDAEPMVLIHGLGATKASMLPIIPELAKSFRIYALDLPGFGSSSKPRGRYDAPWFAERVFGFMDSLGLSSATLVGNSMGGRIAQEMAMRDPERVDRAICLCPATAFSRRPALVLARVLRPELGFAVGRLPRKRLRAGLEDLFARPGRLESSWYDAAIDDFLRTWRSPRARMAFFASARHIYLEEPHGERGFWARLSELDGLVHYVFGKQDVLISHHFARKVRESVPHATVEVWDDCGHAPQIEHPKKVVEAIMAFTSGERDVRSA
ncbi:MAG TPA: alpha/beta fold hydrolase [Actinomycetota bacterium]|nr:alpha/beta fold hydrolase [Actinomycetota bacterium]